MKQQTLSMAQERVGDLQQLVQELENRLEDKAREMETLVAAREEDVTRLQAQVWMYTACQAAGDYTKLAMPHILIFFPPSPLLSSDFSEGRQVDEAAQSCLSRGE